MQTTMQLGRIAGVRVGLHWSVVGIVALVFGLMVVRLSDPAQGHDWPVTVPAAALAAVLFVASLLAHEMAHAIVARRNGVVVDGITLWLLGGVARLRGQAPTPGAEFRIAGVGPIVSVLIAGVCGGAAWGVDALGVGPLVVSVLAYVAGLNALLVVFNLVPAAPLDGGRILRAGLWAWRGDRIAATVAAAKTGRVFGFALIALGLVEAVVGDGIGLWWILIGLFVVTLAGSEEQQARHTSALAGLRVRDVMTPDPEAVDGDRSVAEFLHEVALLRRYSAFPLLDDSGRLQGLATVNRIRSVPTERRGAVALRDVACPPGRVPLAEPDELLSAVLPRLDGCADGRFLVFADGNLVGIVSPSDISRAVTLHGLGVRMGSGGADVVEVDRNLCGTERQ